MKTPPPLRLSPTAAPSSSRDGWRRRSPLPRRPPRADRLSALPNDVLEVDAHGAGGRGGDRRRVKVSKRRCWRCQRAANRRQRDPPRRLPDSAGEPAVTVWVERAGKRSWGAPPRVRRCGLNECSAGAAWASSTRDRPADAVGLRRRDGLGRGGVPRRPGGAPASRSERGGGCAGKVLDEMLVSLLWW
jgi:hypothetical protein